MEKYDSYKDSGIEWIGEIPNHWDESKIKYLSKEPNSLFIDGDWIESKVIIEEGIRYITTGNIKVGYYSEQGSGFISEETFSELNCTEVFEGDLVISRLNNPIGRACIIPNLNNRIVTSVDNVIFRPDSNVNKFYLLYLFSSKEYFEITDLISRGATMQRISRGLYGNIKIPLPSIEEQTTIAKYLDNKTNQIESLISKKVQFISLLQEERTTVINQAVTKGLDPNVSMKNSGIEWLGKIPKHWQLKPLKHIVKCNNEALNEKTNPHLEIKYIEIGDVSSSNGIQCCTSYLFSEAPSRARRIVREGDVIISTVRTYLKAISSIPKEFDGYIASTGFAVLTPQKINSAYLGFIAITDGVIGEIISMSKGVSYPSITSQDLVSISIPYPCNEEQILIAEYLFRKTSEIDKIIVKSQQEIELLKEYKTALISEVVTGKVDVRNEILN